MSHILQCTYTPHTDTYAHTSHKHHTLYTYATHFPHHTHITNTYNTHTQNPQTFLTHTTYCTLYICTQTYTPHKYCIHTPHIYHIYIPCMHIHIALIVIPHTTYTHKHIPLHTIHSTIYSTNTALILTTNTHTIFTPSIKISPPHLHT